MHGSAQRAEQSSATTWRLEWDAAQQRRDLTENAMRLLGELYQIGDGREEFSVPWQGIIRSLYPMPESTARNARDELVSCGIIDAVFPKGPNGGPTRKRGQGLFHFTLYRSPRWKPETATVWARPSSSDDRQGYLAFEQSGLRIASEELAPEGGANLAPEGGANLAPPSTPMDTTPHAGGRASSSSSSSKCEESDGQEADPAVIGIVREMLVWLGWNPSLVKPHEMIALLKIAQFATNGLGMEWAEEVCIETRGTPIRKDGNRIGKLRGTARNKSGMVPSAFMKKWDAPLSLKLRKAAMRAFQTASGIAPAAASAPAAPTHVPALSKDATEQEANDLWAASKAARARGHFISPDDPELRAQLREVEKELAAHKAAGETIDTRNPSDAKPSEFV